MKETATEFFNRVNKIEDEYERAKALWSNDNTRVRDFLKIVLDPQIEWMLPPGAPPYTAADEVHTHSNFWTEVKRLPVFVKSSDNYQNISEARRQMLYIQVLEYVHPTDAQLLLRIKDGEWPFEKITADLVNRIWPNLIATKDAEITNV